MKVRMTNKSFPLGEAHVLPEDQATWEAAGWVADPAPSETTDKDTKK
jgi:uncharacterized protein with LGFP repeats